MMDKALEAYKYDMLTIASKFYKLGSAESRGILTAIEHAEITRKVSQCVNYPPQSLVE